jgi:glycosyltransferase involved in cell wall biosynthesis
MRILLVSYFFPPYNVVGAVRAAKFAKYFERFGHDVWVLSAQEQPFSEGLALESSPARVRYASWLNVNAPVEALMGGRKKIAMSGYGGGRRGSLVRHVGQLYKTFLHSPDAQLGWFPFAVAEGNRLLASLPFDLVYASAPPFSGLMAAARIAKRAGVPWVAEFRDLWTMNNAYAYPAWRRSVEGCLERRTLASATALVTVSQPLATMLRTRNSQPIIVSANGFDPDDHAPQNSESTATDVMATDRLNLLYTGILYEEHYELDVLAEAFALLKARGLQSRIHASFYGRYLGAARAAMNRHDVAEMVSAHEPVPYRDALMLQRSADVLLLFPWGREADQGVMSTKIYEYLGARRPILGVGNPDADASKLLVARKAGFASRDPDAIASYLAAMLEEKTNTGRVHDLPMECAAGLTREERMRELDAFLSTIVKSDSAARSSR